MKRVGIILFIVPSCTLFLNGIITYNSMGILTTNYGNKPEVISITCAICNDMQRERHLRNNNKRMLYEWTTG